MTWAQRTFMTAVIAAIVGGAALMGWAAWMASQHTEPTPIPVLPAPVLPAPPTVLIPADM